MILEKVPVGAGLLLIGFRRCRGGFRNGRLVIGRGRRNGSPFAELHRSKSVGRQSSCHREAITNLVSSDSGRRLRAGFAIDFAIEKAVLFQLALRGLCLIVTPPSASKKSQQTEQRLPWDAHQI